MGAPMSPRTNSTVAPPSRWAELPILRGLAARGTVGRAAVIPTGMPAGSDVGNMSILGYDPALYHTGRAPIEAAALGLTIGADEIAFRCNLVTIGDDETMVDFAGGHPSSETAAEVIAALQSELGGDGVRFHPGLQYRHIVVAPATWSDADCMPPHDLSDKPVVWPTGAAATKVRQLMDGSRAVLSRFELKANQVWLWGQGSQPRLPAFRDEHGVEAGLVTAVDVVRGLAMLTRMRVVEVPGATGWYDTDYEAKRDAALAGLDDGLDLFVVHVEATDEAGHAGDATEKVRALEHWDSRILADLVAGLDERGPWRLLLLPDHPTPLHRKTHTADPVPYLMVDSDVDGPGGIYTEGGVASVDVVSGHSLLKRMLDPSSVHWNP